MGGAVITGGALFWFGGDLFPHDYRPDSLFLFFFPVFLIHTGAKCRRYAFVNPQGCCFAWDGKWANSEHTWSTSKYLIRFG